MNIKPSTLAITVVLTLGFFGLASSARTAGAAPQRPIGDTGLVVLGPNQVVRVTVSARVQAATVRFRQFEYAPSGINAGVKSWEISGQAQSDLVNLPPGSAASYDLPASTAVRATLTSDEPTVKVSAVVVDTNTGEVVSFVGGTDDGSSI